MIHVNAGGGGALQHRCVGRTLGTGSRRRRKGAACSLCQNRARAPRNSAFLRHLAANRASYWDYDSPIRFHYGLADEAIHPAMAQRALSAGGKLATGVPVAGGSHRGTFLAGLYGDSAVLGGNANALGWFDGFH